MAPVVDLIAYKKKLWALQHRCQPFCERYPMPFAVSSRHEFEKGFLPKTGIPGHFGARNRYQVHSKTKFKSNARSPAIGQLHIVPVGLKRPPGTLGFVYCLAFNCFWRSLSQSEAIYEYPDTYHTTSHSNGLMYGYTYEVSSHFTRIGCCCLLKRYG